MSQHTAGPWNIERPYAEMGLYVAGPDTALVARVWNNNEANGRLIAAAPALLRVAEELVRLIDAGVRVQVIRGMQREEDDFLACVLSARVAISKAEGAR